MIEDETEIREHLFYLTAKIVQESTYHHCLKTLFALEQGTWIAAELLFKGTDELLEKFETLQECDPPIDIYVNWLPFPQSVYGPGYTIITFYSDSIHWGNVIFYNKGHLDSIDI